MKQQTTKKILIWIFSLFIFHSSLLSNDAILSIDTGGHTALMRDIIVTKSGDIISASDDKTIRVWSSRDGAQKRKILGQIGAGSEGKIYAIALSSDEQYLAVGGLLTGETNEEKSSIRLYDHQSGKLLTVLKSHTNAVTDLAFSPDGRYLASGSADKTVKLWDMKSFSLFQTITFHTNTVYGVKFTDKNTLISSSYDNRIALHSLAGKLLHSYTHNEKLRYIATNGKTIATCGNGNEILLFDQELHLQSKIQSKTEPSGLSYSPNGRYLITGTSNYPLNVNIYDSQKNYAKIATFDKHTNTTQAVAFLDNKTAISGGGNNNEIYIWDIKSKKVKTKIVGAGQSVWSVGCEGDSIAWGNVVDAKSQNDRGRLQKSFNLKTLLLNSISSDGGFKRINSDGLSHSAGGDYGYGDAVLNIKSSGVSITKDAYTGYGHNCYGWYKDYIISGGNNGDLKIYDTSGAQIASLVGHTGMIWSIALDGDRLVSGSSDQTIKVWDLKKIVKKIAKIRITEIIKGSVADIAGLKVGDKIININGTEFYSNYDFTQYIQDKKDYHFVISRNEQDIELYINKNQNIFGFGVNIIENIIYPTASLFVSNDNEWVLWTPQGYYNASLKGDRFIKWHINQGSDKEALSYPVGRFKEKYYQPELFEYLLDSYTLSEALAKVGKKEQKVSISESLPPYLTFAQYPETDTKDGNVNLKVRVISKSEITNYKYLFDGRPLENTRALKPKINNDTITLSLTLPKQSGTLSIQAHNKFGYSEPVEFKINYLGEAQNVLKPKLYVLAIGVAEYDDKEIRLDFSAKDAKDFANVMGKQKGKLYSDVVVKTLTNKEASKDNILDGLEWIQKETTSRDVAMVFIAGHGVNDENGHFYFLPVNFDDSKLKRTGVAFSEFKTTLASIAGKVILFADACHSGNIMGKRRSIDTTGLIQELNDAENGVVVFTSSTGKQYSLEDKAWNNGAFTKALVEGLEGKADMMGNGKITVDGLSYYVSERVKKLTNGKQTPAGSKPNTISDFPIGVK
jgi:WD40 repeat protein